MKRLLGKQTISVLALLILAALVLLGARSCRSRAVPVLLYHHFAQESTSDLVVTPEAFRRQMTAIKEAGFTAITLQDMLDYVERGKALPEKPVLITMDDGYTSNLTMAAPILEELDLCATVFVIGIYEGETRSPHNGWILTPTRFSAEEAAPWVEKGVLDLQYHGYDMHRLAEEGTGVRSGMLPLEGETAQQYRAALEEDLGLFRQRREGWPGGALPALAYPYGYYTEEADRIFAELGIPITFTVEERCSRLREGHPESLRLLGRFNVTEDHSGRQLVRRLERALR